MFAFEEIYTTYFTDVYRYALGLCRNEALAEDITQETFLKALRGIDSFHGGCKLYVWLCQIAKNTYFSLRRKQQTAQDFADGTWDEGFERYLADRESVFEIHKALHVLEDPYKEVFSLRMFGELPFKQIAELFGKTESWARVTFYRAKIKIKEALP